MKKHLNSMIFSAGLLTLNVFVYHVIPYFFPKMNFTPEVTLWLYRGISILLIFAIIDSFLKALIELLKPKQTGDK